MASLTSQGYGDFILLGGVKSPGLCDVSGAASTRKWEQRPGFGMSGATSVYLGTTLAEFSIKFRLYGEPHGPSGPDPDWQQWNVFEATVLMRPPAGKQPKALVIWHPVLERLKIASVGVTEVGQPYQDDKGEWTIEVKFIEFRRPKITLAKPEAAKASPQPDFADVMTNALIAQVQEAAKG
jgi:hypothetical protein